MKAIAEKIKSKKNIIITAHISEDADAIGSTYALSEALSGMGKNVTLYLSDHPEERLQFLEYPYKVYEEGDVAEQDLLICLDAGDTKRLGKRSVLLERSQSIVIDHHYQNPGYGDINYIDGEASSTGELIYLLLKELNAEITKRIAEFLYISISGDTGSFKYSSTSPRTMRIVADLMETGIDHAELSRRLHETESIEAVLLKGRLMSEIKSYYGGKLRIVSIDKETFDKFGVSEKNVGDIVNIPRTVEGTEIAVSVRETEEKIKLSFRSNGKYNVSEIAEKFGGGGHEMAAGAAIFEKSIDEALESIVEEVGKCFND